MLALLVIVSSGHAATYSEEAVKAAFLHRFAAYVQWPSQSRANDAFVIAVYRADPVADQLKLLLPGIAIQNRRAEVRKVNGVKDLEGAQILYIGAGALNAARDLLTASKNRPLLIVTDDQEGLSRGGIINFVHVGRTIRFEVSLTAADRSGLKISAGLLSVAARVEGRPQAGVRCLGRLSVGRLALCGPLLTSGLAPMREPHEPVAGA